MTEFMERMTHEADEIGRLMEQTSRYGWKARVGDRTNVKPFYSPYANFDPAICDTVVIGGNPGGNPRNPDTITTAYLDDLNKPRGEYNAYLDETWERSHAPGQANLQQGVQKVFKALYAADAWMQQLRDAASFNVCPLRTYKAQHIPMEVWDASVDWCREILSYLQPKRVICIANVGPKTPWCAVKGPIECAKFTRDVGEPSDAFPAIVRAGKAGFQGLNGCEVIGFPHLSYHHATEALFDALREYAEQRRALTG